MPHIFSGIIVALILLIPAPLANAQTPPFTLEFGKLETVFDWSASNCGNDHVLDDPANALVDSQGNVHLYTSHYDARKFVGDNLSDIKPDCAIIFSGHHGNTDPAAFDTYEWLASPYTLDGTTIYSLVHNEYHGDSYNNCRSATAHASLDCWYNSINLAKSTDGGKTFTQRTPPSHNIAHIAAPFNPDNTSYNLGAFHPSNIVSHEGYFYATVLTGMTGLGQRICLMRSNNLEDPGSWHFWNGTNFATTARGLSATNNCAGISYSDFNLQKNTYLQQLTIATGRSENGIPKVEVETSHSLDPTSWPPVVKPGTFRFTRPGNPLSVYHTFIQPGAESRNFEDIDRSPWLYFVGCGEEKAGCTSFVDFNRDLKRVRVRFNKPGDVGKYDVLNLKFNEYKGTKALDSSFYTHDGTLTGAAAFVQDGATKFIRLGPGAGAVTVPHTENLDVTGNMSISLKLRTSQSPGSGTYPPLIAKQATNNRHFGVYLTPTGNLHFSGMNGTALTSSVSTKKINDGNWHDILITFSDATGRSEYWIDNQKDLSIVQGGKLGDGLNTAPVIIGGNAYIGDMDHVALYNYHLKPQSEANTPKSGDLNADSHVNLEDYNLLVAGFGTKYTLADYNNLVANFGK